VKIDEAEKAGMCPDLFARMIVFASGDVALCGADQGGYYKIGNALEQSIEELYNSEIFNNYREKWLNSKVAEAKHCNECTITVSRFNKTYQSV
jgi:radical SAM protein with 4Fe4S-binding SPASM domain